MEIKECTCYDEGRLQLVTTDLRVLAVKCADCKAENTQGTVYL